MTGIPEADSRGSLDDRPDAQHEIPIARPPVMLLDPQPTGNGSAVTALAWRHELTVPAAGDPALKAFATYWLGRGASP